MPETTGEIIRRALLDVMADPEGSDCNANEDDCFRRHPVHLGWSVGNEVEVVYVQVKEVGAVVAAALEAAGRLLPEGGETREEWCVRWGNDLEHGCGVGNAAEAEAMVRRFRRGLAGSSGLGAVAKRRYVGPWVAVDEEATDA